MKKKMHFRDIRLFVNAGMSFPTCHANAELLDLDKNYWWTTNRKEDVTCKKCKKKLGMRNIFK